MKHLLTVVAILCLAACGKDINNKEAVKAAIVKRVSKTGFDVNSMQVDVKQVSFHDRDAVATVAFLPKGGPEQSAVTFKYNLHREKDEWVATGIAQSATGTAPHGGGMSAGPVDPSQQTLPAGHPPIGKQP